MVSILEFQFWEKVFLFSSYSLTKEKRTLSMLFRQKMLKWTIFVNRVKVAFVYLFYLEIEFWILELNGNQPVRNWKIPGAQYSKSHPCQEFQNRCVGSQHKRHQRLPVNQTINSLLTPAGDPTPTRYQLPARNHAPAIKVGQKHPETPRSDDLGARGNPQTYCTLRSQAILPRTVLLRGLGWGGWG